MEPPAGPRPDIRLLQRSLGNAAFARLFSSTKLGQTGGPTSATISPSAVLQRADEGQASEAPAEAEGAPAPEKPSTELMERSTAVEFLQDTYGAYVKKVKGGKVRVLPQAEFEEAYDRIYGRTRFAWRRYIVPNEGNLDGFAYKRVSYINKDTAEPGDVVHETLHHNQSSAWKRFAGAELNEGATDYLTLKALEGTGYTQEHSYPDQEGVVRQLVAITGEDLLINAYFKGVTAPLRKEMEEYCVGSWRRFRKAMQAKDWLKARAYLEILPLSQQQNNSKPGDRNRAVWLRWMQHYACSASEWFRAKGDNEA